MENGSTRMAVPLRIMIDIQLGSDGHPWIRMQFATPSLSASTVFPYESAEDVISNITEGIRKQVKAASRKQVETVVPDFTGIQVSRP